MSFSLNRLLIFHRLSHSLPIKYIIFAEVITDKFYHRAIQSIMEISTRCMVDDWFVIGFMLFMSMIYVL